jgi:hypothetical protein
MVPVRVFVVLGFAEKLNDTRVDDGPLPLVSPVSDSHEVVVDADQVPVQPDGEPFTMNEPLPLPPPTVISSVERLNAHWLLVTVMVLRASAGVALPCSMITFAV